MNYLYGDSTASTLKENFLEFLRDTIDFCVLVLQADARIKQGRAQIRVLGDQADSESERLDRFVMSVSRAVQSGDKGGPESPTAQCGSRLGTMIVEAHRTTLDGIRQTLADAITRIEAEEAAGRDGCVKALGALLAPHNPPESTSVRRLVMGTDGLYHASLTATGSPELGWTLELAIPEGHAWSMPMRVDRLAPHLEIKGPQLAGWITKEVRTKPQRLERHVVAEIVDDGESVRLELRTEASPDIGFDLEVHPETSKVAKAARVGPSDDASVGAFEVQSEDVAALVELATKLRASLDGIERLPNVTATFEKTDFRTLPSFVDFVTKLVAFLEPIVSEIARRSLTPNELVLRRALANDRREEIFVAKATLREKLSVLPGELRAIFIPLGLDLRPTPSLVPAVAVPAAPSDRPPVRSELPPSVPPPPMPPFPGAAGAGRGPANLEPRRAGDRGRSPGVFEPKARDDKSERPPAGSIPPKAVATFTPVRPPGGTGRTIQPPQGAPPPAPLAPAEEPPALQIDEIEISSDALLEVMPDSERELVSGTEANPRNEALVGSLKKIMTLSKAGRAVEAYEAFEQLFSSAAFATYRSEEQRQAIKLMVRSKAPSDLPAVHAAYRAALKRLEALVELSLDTGDGEVLGAMNALLAAAKS